MNSALAKLSTHLSYCSPSLPFLNYICITMPLFRNNSFRNNSYTSPLDSSSEQNNSNVSSHDSCRQRLPSRSSSYGSFGSFNSSSSDNDSIISKQDNIRLLQIVKSMPKQQRQSISENFVEQHQTKRRSYQHTK